MKLRFEQIFVAAMVLLMSQDFYSQKNKIINDSLKSGNNSNFKISSYTEEKNYLLPAIEVVGLNLTVWSYSKFIKQSDFADISWNSVQNNFKIGFVGDTDSYLMN